MLGRTQLELVRCSGLEENAKFGKVRSSVFQDFGPRFEPFTAKVLMFAKLGFWGVCQGSKYGFAKFGQFEVRKNANSVLLFCCLCYRINILKVLNLDIGSRV